MAKNKKYIFITGGVVSSLGKGLAAASIGCLLERRGLKINLLKMDPYINVDPGTMSPTQHGEVFVTEDGAETDLDLGHYERFTKLTLKKSNNFTSGQIYLEVIEKEREGEYLGKTVQVVPHITDEIKRRIRNSVVHSDVIIGEIGGTVGDIESLPFLEAIRQITLEEGVENVLLIHLVYLPYIKAANEIKTKPSQHSVKELRSIGLTPSVIICRAEEDFEQQIVDKISHFCHVPKNNVFKSIDLESIYQLPIEFHRQGIDSRITELLGMWATEPKIDDLNSFIDNFKNPKVSTTIGIVGKYTELVESYKSLDEALKHASINLKTDLNIKYIDAEEIEKGNLSSLKEVQGILVPGGFGSRGTEGKIKAIEYARTSNVPYFGICLGMQLAMIEFARHQAGIKDATSIEFADKGSFIVSYMEGQSQEMRKGGSMRLGAFPCSLKKGSRAFQIYQKPEIEERHRHRLEVNNQYVEQLERSGMTVSGYNKELNLVEMIEISDHPYFVGCQFHPEFLSKPFSPHPLFVSFIEAANNFAK